MVPVTSHDCAGINGGGIAGSSAGSELPSDTRTYRIVIKIKQITGAIRIYVQGSYGRNQRRCRRVWAGIGPDFQGERTAWIKRRIVGDVDRIVLVIIVSTRYVRKVERRPHNTRKRSADIRARI